MLGVPLTIELTVVDVSSASEAGTPAEGAAVYVWHCDRAGNYSLYSDAAKDENCLRGVQEADDGYSVQLATVTGTLDGGLTARLRVPI